MTAKDLAITYRTLREMATGNKQIIPALKAVLKAWETMPREETQGKPICIFPTNQGGRQREKPSLDSKILELRHRDASLRTIAYMAGCSVKHVQTVINTEGEERRQREEDRIFWETITGNKLPAEIEGQLHFPGFDNPKEEGHKV